MNPIALSTGLVLKLKRMWRAFQRGCQSATLIPEAHRAQLDNGRWQSTGALRDDILETRSRVFPES